MNDLDFRQTLERMWDDGKWLFLALDSDVDKLPHPLRLRHTEYSPTTPRSQTWLFREKIIPATADIVGGYKLHPAFLDERQMYDTCARIRHMAPGVLILIDGKYGGGSWHENKRWAEFAFDYLKADAVTVQPFPGLHALQPFLDWRGKCVFVLCRTSEHNSAEFQWADVCGDVVPGGYMPLFKFIAHRVATHWNANFNCGLVAGATHASDLKEIRERGLDLPILSPGIGEQQQGVPLEQQIACIMSSNGHPKGRGIIPCAGRLPLYASDDDDFADACRRTVKQINALCKQHLPA